MPTKPSTPDFAGLQKLARSLFAKKFKLADVILTDVNEVPDPESGKILYRFNAAAGAKANGPQYGLILDAQGKPRESTPQLEALLDRTATVHSAAAGAPVRAAPPITIEPASNDLTLNPGDTLHEVITVTIPKNATISKTDVYFLADTTGSMGGILSAVQAGANNILTALNGLGLDLAFGVGNYKDFPSDIYCFQHQLSPTNATASVAAAINAWAASGGKDGPEGQLFALDRLAVPPGGSIGWRSGSKRIIVWFGDVAGHDPICTAISPQVTATITEASVTAKLQAEAIAVLAISTANPGLDGDPKLGSTNYLSQCGPPGGTAGQATRISSATGGSFVTGISPPTIVNTIISLVTNAVGTIQNVKLVPAGGIVPFVTSISPAAGYGPLSSDKDHVLTFEVTFTGVLPCKAELQIILGTLDVVVDGAVAVAKPVRITVPPCPPKFVNYSVKFVCGTQPDCPCDEPSVRPGVYSTEINIHNYTEAEVKIQKRVIPVVLAGAPRGREPRTTQSKAEDSILLPPHSATMDDCCRIAELLLGGQPASPMPLTIGFLEIKATLDVAITAVYTVSDLKSGAVSIDVEQVNGRLVS